MFDDHDPLCPFSNGSNGPVHGCQCGLIAKVRSDEQERYDVVLRLREALAVSQAVLRAKVEALPRTVVELKFAPMGPRERVHAIVLKQVLALIDGKNDD